MATIKLCDWSKLKIPQGVEVFTVTVDGQEFEVSQESRDALLEQFKGEDPPIMRAVPTIKKSTGESSQEQIETPVQPIQIEQEPLDVSPNSMPIQPMAQDEVLDIPDDIRKPLRKASPKLAQRIVEESKHFDEGTLPSLTMGAKQQRQAMKKLQDLEETENEKIRRRARHGVRINFNNEIGPMR